MLKQFTKVFCILLLVAVFAFMFVYCVFLPRTTASEYDKDLKTWPEFSLSALFSGDYFSDIMLYFTDTVHGRDRFKDYNSIIGMYYGIYDEDGEEFFQREEGDGEGNTDGDGGDLPVDLPDVSGGEDLIIGGTSSKPSDESDISANTRGDVSDITSEPSADSSEMPSETPDESDTTSQPSSGGMAEEISNDILILGTRALEIYYGSEDRSKLFAETLNAFAEKLDPSVNVYSMVIPKASAYYLKYSETYAKLADRCKNNIETVASNLSERIKNVDAYNAMLPHESEEIYFRTDHHWTALGAYYAVEEFCQVAGVNCTPLDNYTLNRREGFVGSMYNYTGKNPKILNNPEDMITLVTSSPYTATFFNQTFSNGFEHDLFWSVSEEKKSSWYLTFICGDTYTVRVKSGTCTNGRKLLIVKDSYGNILPTLLVDSFEEIYVVDARKFELSLVDTVNSLGITDVLFAEVAYSAVGKDYINALSRLSE